VIIIEIALGIVLAVVVLRYWQEIIGYGILGVLYIAVFLSVNFWWLLYLSQFRFNYSVPVNYINNNYINCHLCYY